MSTKDYANKTLPPEVRAMEMEDRRPKRRGKPRRGKGRAVVTSVRIDLDAEAVLKKEFGSLGNALYWTYVGIIKYRERKGAQRYSEGQIRRPRMLRHKEMVSIIKALDFRLENLFRDEHKKEFEEALDVIASVFTRKEVNRILKEDFRFRRWEENQEDDLKPAGWKRAY